MTDTAMVSRKRRTDGPAPLIDGQLADEPLGKARVEGVELLGADGLMIARTLEGLTAAIDAVSYVLARVADGLDRSHRW